MKNYPIDVQTYVFMFTETLSKDDSFIELCEYSDVEVIKFLEYVKDGLLLKSTENLIDLNSPTLSIEQYDRLLNECVIKYHLDEMVEQGILESNFDIETGEMLYKSKNLFNF